MYSGVSVIYYILYGVDNCFFFQAEDGIRDLVRSRGLGDVYKRQELPLPHILNGSQSQVAIGANAQRARWQLVERPPLALSLIHI